MTNPTQHNHGLVRNPELAAILKADGLRQLAFMPLAANDDYFMVSTVPSSVGENKTSALLAADMTLAYCPGWPVVPTMAFTDAAADDWTAVSATFIGIDQFGDPIEETVASASSATPWAITATKAFQSFISIGFTITGTTTSSDRYKMGYAKTYGLGCKPKSSAEVIATLFNGAADAGTLSLVHYTYIPAGTPDAAKELILLMRPTGHLN